MIAFVDIERMSVTERLQSIEMLWNSLSRDDSLVESPAWHGQVLDSRRSIIAEEKATFLTLDELRNRLARP
jgi:putative addiction module component (TIGR02574 family)